MILSLLLWTFLLVWSFSTRFGVWGENFLWVLVVGFFGYVLALSFLGPRLVAVVIVFDAPCLQWILLSDAHFLCLTSLVLWQLSLILLWMSLIIFDGICGLLQFSLFGLDLG